MTRRIGVLSLAGAVGYISLSQEILWMRVFSYSTGGSPTVFAHVLGVFLTGVAFGALTGQRLCARRVPPHTHVLARFTGAMLMVSAILFYSGIPLTLAIAKFSDRLGAVALYGAALVVSFSLGGIFPVLCQYAARKAEAAGVTVSRIYLANIVGSTLGPLVTGFVLMQYLTTAELILGLSLGTFALGVAALPSKARGAVGSRVAVITCVATVLLVTYRPLYAGLLERLRPHHEPQTLESPYKYQFENRSGIITVAAGVAGFSDTIFGGGMYDGRFNTDPVNDTNGIRRAYMIAALHPAPTDVLEIGLSSGSWTRVMANYVPIRKITVVEINPGYLDIVARYPEQATVLRDPRVTIVIDDGRRWLMRNPQAQFDLIVQNTTLHWRSNVTNLLSEEWLLICKRHLKPGGVIYYNSTNARDVPYTAARVFKYVTGYSSFVAASDSPFKLDPEHVRANLRKFSLHAERLPAESNKQVAMLFDQLARSDLSDKAPQLRTERRRWKITDDNMATEFKQQRWYAPEWSWLSLWNRRLAQAKVKAR